MADVVVIAGTADARQIIEEIIKSNISVAATVTTSFGKDLLKSYPGLSIYEGKLTSEGMVKLIQDTGAKCLVDASHPYARDASINAMTACEQAGVPYLRFEREHASLESSKVLRVDSFEAAANSAAEFEGNIFLTTGSNNLEVFIKKIPDYKDRLYVRVLPECKVLARCEELGLTAKNIIAVKGPFTEEMNVEMIKHCKAAVLVTKDSGEAGGTAQKVSAASKAGIPVILVERPKIGYNVKVESIAEVIEFVRNILCKGC